MADKITGGPSVLHTKAKTIDQLPTFASFLEQADKKHREAAHQFVDILFDSMGVDGDHNLWRRLLSAMMDDYQRWRNRDPSKKFLPRMAIPLEDMRGDDD